jgi:hypothetical protein
VGRVIDFLLWKAGCHTGPYAPHRYGRRQEGWVNCGQKEGYQLNGMAHFCTMQQLSPEKYVLTKARTLPIDKCMINIGWQENRMASVVICRRHVTGNLTVGIYLVDLLCLGVKDSFYFFNITPEELEERVPIEGEFETISYELAHNIVYAGHDFALEFEIKPCREFTVTQYILEEDDDRIPLLDIDTGDKTGKPHLMARPGAATSEALAKLRQHAGEGNFVYTLVDDDIDDEEEDDYEGDYDEEDWGDEDDLNKIPIGEVTAYVAQQLSTESMLDDTAYEMRYPMEQIAIKVELCWRSLNDEDSADCDYLFVDELMKLPEYTLLKQAESGMHTQAGFLMWQEINKDDLAVNKVDELFSLPVEDFTEALEQLPTELQDNPNMAILLYEALLTSQEHSDYRDLILPFLKRHAATCPLAALYLDFDAYVIGGDLHNNQAASSQRITDYLPGYTYYGNQELHVYWLIKLTQAIRENDLRQTAKFYSLAFHSQFISPLLIITQILLLNYLSVKVTASAEPTDEVQDNP